jgi:hypothetical protein
MAEQKHHNKIIYHAFYNFNEGIRLRRLKINFSRDGSTLNERSLNEDVI